MYCTTTTVACLNYTEEQARESNTDNVRAYACNILSSGLLYMEFVDAIREGDGSRLIRCWKYFLLHFKVSHRTNYAVEAFVLLAHQKFFLSPRMAMQLTWNRTVNIHGSHGKNVPCDLHMEHLNKEAKQRLAGLGSNITNESVSRVGRSIKITIEITKQFAKENQIKEPSCRKSRRSCNKDIKLLLKQLSDDMVFDNIADRAHRNYSSIKPKSIKHLRIKELNEWMKIQYKKMLRYH